MKKSLVALAALAATTAFAQSSVSITGNLDVGYQSFDIKGNKVTNSSGSNGSSTTAVFFRGTEDLGGGLKANFQWEVDPSLADTSSRTAGTAATGTTSNVTSSIGNGQSFIELAGGFGAIKLGTPNLTTLSANGDGNSGFATAIGSGYRVTSFDAVRFQNSLRYDTPSFSGLSLGYVQSAKNDKQSLGGTAGQTGNLMNQTNGRDQATEVSLTYANGPLTVRYADLQMKQWADVALIDGTKGAYGYQSAWSATDGKKFNLKTLSARYAVNKDLTVGYFNQQTDSDALVASSSGGVLSTARFDRTAQGLSAAYYVKPNVKLMINRATAKNGANHLAASSAAGGSNASANLKTTVTGLGADYELSKRTALYFRTETDKDAAGMRSTTGYTIPTGNTTYKATAIGVRHTF
jgi:predicted porin